MVTFPPLELVADAGNVRVRDRFTSMPVRAIDEAGYQEEVTVREPTRLDWVFATAIQFWELFVQDGQDEMAVEEAKRRLPGLKTLASE